MIQPVFHLITIFISNEIMLKLTHISDFYFYYKKRKLNRRVTLYYITECQLPALQYCSCMGHSCIARASCRRVEAAAACEVHPYK